MLVVLIKKDILNEVKIYINFDIEEINFKFFSLFCFL